MNHNDLVVENELNFLNSCGNESKSKYLHDRPVAMEPCDTDGTSRDGQCNYTIVLPDGNRYFLKPRNKKSDVVNSRVTSGGNLLTKSMDEIAREADAIKVNILAKKALSENRILEAEASKHRAVVDTDDLRLDDDIQEIVQKNILVESGLWVDKYAPKSFAQLLSPEKINREVLRALKLWDPYVFRDKSAAVSGSSATLSEGNVKGSTEMDVDVTVNDDVEDNDDEYDVDRIIPVSKDKGGTVSVKDIRPQYRIILLCGPPGTGKTTLAHCVAKQCGYRPFEVNASDDRSAAILKDTMARAMHGNTIVGDRRPNCIILDEIDGIDGKQSIDALLTIVKAPLNLKANKGKRRTESLALTRPLICICNDEYSPALRELKNLSIRFRFTPPSEARLVQRLKAVCSIEGLNTNTNSLTTLCSATGNDIRASINTLQFASMRARELINKRENVKHSTAIGEVLSSMISSGLKDEHKDILQVWREIFSRKEIQAIMYHKKQRLLGQYGQDHIVNTKASSGRGGRVLDPCMEVIQSTIDHGDLALVLSGIHENIYKIPFSDPNMSRVQRALDWLSMSDNLNTFTMTNPDGFQVLGYIAPTAGAIHCLCAVDNNVKVDWPKVDKNNYHKTQQKLSILNSLRESKATSILSNRTLIALDSISYILDLINPKFKQSFSVSHSLSKTERQQLHNIVQIMHACGLSYSTSKIIDSSVMNSFNQNASLQLEPPISELVKYCASENIVCDELASRRVYLHQEIRYMVRSDLRKYVISVKGDATADEMDTAKPSPNKSSPSYKRKAGAADAANEVLAELDESHEKRLRISRMDFFCKPKESKGSGNVGKDVNSENTTQASRSKPGVQFKYNQGFSNAVRRPVSISEFIY